MTDEPSRTRAATLAGSLRRFLPAAAHHRAWDLEVWLRVLVAATFGFGTIEILAGIWFAHVWSAVSGIALLAYGLVVMWSRRRFRAEDGVTVAIVVGGLLLLAIALAMVLPLGRAPLAIVPVMASLLATAHGGMRAGSLVAACWLGAMALALVPLVGTRETVIPESFRAGLLVATQAFVGTMSIVLAFRLYGSLRNALADAREREQEARAFFEHALDAVITIDQRGMVVGWNPRAEEMFGWPVAEAIGRPLSNLVIPLDQRAAHEAGLRRAVATGAGPVLNTRTQVDARHRDGTTFPVELSVVPLELGGRAVFGGFIRDLSAERAADERLWTERRHRAEVAAALASLRAAATVEETAAAICSAALAHTTMTVAGMYRFLPSGEMVPLAIEAPPGAPITVGKAVDQERADYLRERSKIGPWVEEWHDVEGLGPYRDQWRQVGLTGSVHAPIMSEHEVTGILILGTIAPIATDELARHLSTAVEFSAVASALLARELESRSGVEASIATLSRVITERSFDIVFQPVIELQGRAVIGYEALTRFRDGTRPDVRFADAHRLGLGRDLEHAALDAAIRAATTLPRGPWLGLNISPEMLLDRRRLERVLDTTDRPVVLELTESMVVSDYHAIRSAIAARPDVRLAVDDAGAGYAGLRHLVELRPALVKLDLHLIRHLDQDTARQALLAGMVHFAESTGCELIAEGIETWSELEAIRSLGVTMGQGFLLGRPAPAAQFVGRGTDPVRKAS